MLKNRGLEFPVRSERGDNLEPEIDSFEGVGCGRPIADHFIHDKLLVFQNGHFCKLIKPGSPATIMQGFKRRVNVPFKFDC